MKKSRFADEQIVRILQDAVAGKAVRDLARQYGVAETTTHLPAEVRRQRGEGLYARGRESPAETGRGGSDARQSNAQRRGGTKVVTTEQRRQVVTYLRAAYPICERRACA